jgi:hypothetical protein
MTMKTGKIGKKTMIMTRIKTMMMTMMITRVCGKKFFLGAGCGVWGVGFYRFSMIFPEKSREPSFF